MSAAILNPLARLADIAEREIGNAESPKGSNKGPAIQKYFGADTYKPNAADNGYAWCASFVSWCVQELLRKFPGVTAPKPPRLAAAFGFVEWGRANGCLIFSPATVRKGIYRPERGDIVVFGFSHVGIVSSVNLHDTNFSAIEGNTDEAGGREGWMVARRARTLAQVELKRPDMGRFIRLSPLAQAVTGGTK